MGDSLGDRMKDFYENRTRHSLARRSYTIIRVDGKAFHTYTRGLDRPFDAGLIEDMNETTKYLCKNIQGAKFGYVQSDEISILVTDFDDLQTDMWFDGNIQKMVSVASSMATAKFNQLRLSRKIKENFGNFSHDPMMNEHEFFQIVEKMKQAEFDARVFQIPSRVEVENYFIWRQQDCTRNSVSSVAQSLYSHKELNGKNSDQKQEMIFQKGINWNNYTPREKRGGFIMKIPKYVMGVDPIGEDCEVWETVTSKRNNWEIVECPIFTEDRYFLSVNIPIHS
jgi:tRNA(His) 5'-end guanylyltransferase